jgi:NAD(P)-dependent dehydrogenase (short-subunit alcohol dehydrogenase family)
MAPTTALIVGGSGGIGSALCRHLLGAGTRVVAVCRHPERLVELQALYPSFKVIQADALNEAEVQRFVRESEKELGRIEAAAYCVGSLLLKPAHLTSSEQFLETLNVNLLGAFLLLKTVAPLMAKSEGGSLLFFSSAAAGLGLPNHEAIAAAKAGLEGMTRAAAMTYARSHVRVNAIAPGLVDTPLSAAIVSNESSLKASISYHPLGRIGKPEDLIEAAAWCLGPSSSWMTGSILSVDGGMRAGRL